MKKTLPNFEGNTCFGCGASNDKGLQMQFYVEDDRVCSDFIIPERYEGWFGIAHGGIVSTLLDEIMSWAAIHFKQKVILTRRMSVEFIHPVKVGQAVTVRGYPIEESEGRATLKGEILDESGTTLAESKGEFALFTLDEVISRGLMDRESLAPLESLLNPSSA